MWNFLQWVEIRGRREGSLIKDIEGDNGFGFADRRRNQDF